MHANDIIKELSTKKFKPIYLLHGEESYYIDIISDYIEKQVLNDAEKGFNQTILYGKDTNIISILNYAKRYPMMSEYQIVIVKEAQELKLDKDSDDSKKTLNPWQAYLENPLKSTILVLCHKYGKFDKRKKTYKSIEKTGLVFESETLYENKIPAWIDDFLREKKLSITPQASTLIAEYLGNNLTKIANELNKMLLNVPQGQLITPKEVQENIGISKDFNVFELQNAIGKRDTYKAVQIITYFSANAKNNPLPLVLGNLNTFFTKLLKFHYCTNQSQQNLAKELGVHPFFVKDYEIAAKNFPLPYVSNAIALLREYDVKSKGVNATGHTEQGELMKEMLLKILIK